MSEKINIFYEGVNDLAGILATSIASLCSNTKSELDIYILDTGLCEFYKKQLLLLQDRFSHATIKFVPVDLTMFDGLKGYRAENFVDCYSRLLIPDLVKDIDKAIYLDSDTVVLKDISLLWNIDMDGKALAAPPDTGISDVIPPHMEKLGVSSDQVYISAGVFVIDCDLWRRKSITKQILKLAREKKDKIIIIIEDLFTIFFGDNFKIIDPSWGFIEYTENAAKFIPIDDINPEYLKKIRNDIAIVHFAGANKVWKTERHWLTQKTILHFNEFWLYAKMTPFYEGLSKSFVSGVVSETVRPFYRESNQSSLRRIKLFNRIPFIKIRMSKTGIRYYLFNFIPLFKVTD